MAFFIGTGIIAFITITLLFGGVAMEKEANSFYANMRRGKAKVAGYVRSDQSNSYELLVSIPELCDGKLYNCASGKINLSQYPEGTVVDVLYAPTTTLGTKVVEVHLCSNPPADAAKVGRGIGRVAFAMLGVAILLAAVGLASL